MNVKETKVFTEVFTEISRQLTRIADTLEMKATNDVRAQQGQSPAYCENAIEDGFSSRPEPAPDVPTDALVEAAKELAHIVDNFIADYRTRYPEITTRIDSFTTKPVLDALAAHEKAVE